VVLGCSFASHGDTSSARNDRGESRAVSAEGTPDQRPDSIPIAEPGVGSRHGTAGCSITLTDVTDATGIEFQHTDGSSGARYIMETVASGVATFDYDRDGLIDIYFLNGAPLRGADSSAHPRNRLYRNLGGFRFVDVTRQAGVGDEGYGLGVAVGDYDADGFPDLYISNFGPNVLYRNNGDGTFDNTTRQAAVAAGDDTKVGAGTCFLDADRDGDLDLFVSNYLKFTYADHLTNFCRGFPIYAGPENFDALPSRLFFNNGDGTFADVSDRLHVETAWGKGMGIVCADYDNDGDTDIMVGNDGRPGNFLLRNDGTGEFDEVGGISGMAYDAAGFALGSMGVACGDYDNDGDLDFFMSNFQGQSCVLFRNLGGGIFQEVARETGAGQGSFNHVTWGCGLVDLDNDGFRDIFYARGHLLDNVDEFDDTTSYKATPVVLKNTGHGTFIDVSPLAGTGLTRKSVGRGVAFDDLDNDGRIDVVILNSRRVPTIIRNECLTGYHWIEIRLHGTRNRDGVGAHVKITVGKTTQMTEVHSGQGYQSHFGTRLYFGLGEDEHIDTIEVDWIGGRKTMVHDIKADRIINISE